MIPDQDPQVTKREIKLSAEIARLRADQQDWRKGVELIASALGYEGKDLACVAIAEQALTLRAEVGEFQEHVQTCKAIELREETERLKKMVVERLESESLHGRIARLESRLQRCDYEDADNFCHWRDEVVPALESRLAQARQYYEVKATEDGLWVHLHGITKEGAVNLSDSIGGPITRCAIAEVWNALRAREEPR